MSNFPLYMLIVCFFSLLMPFRTRNKKSNAQSISNWIKKKLEADYWQASSE